MEPNERRARPSQGENANDNESTDDWQDNLDKLGDFGGKLQALRADSYEPGEFFAHGGVMAVRIDHDDPLYAVYIDGTEIDLVDVSEFTNLVALHGFLARYVQAIREGHELPWDRGSGPWVTKREESDDGDLPDGRRGFQ